MKLFIKILLLLLLPFFSKAQSPQSELDSLHLKVQLAKNDTIRMNALKDLGGYYDDVNLDSSVHYSEKAIAIAGQLQLRFDEATTNALICWPIFKMGNYPRALKLLNMDLDFFGNPANEKYIYNVSKGQTPGSIRLYWLSYIHMTFCGLYSYTDNYEKAIVSGKEAIRIAEYLKDTLDLAYSYSTIVEAYIKFNKLDSALYYCQGAVDFYEAGIERKYLADVYIQIGEIFKQKGEFILAKENFVKAIQTGILYNNPILRGEAQLELARLFQSQSKFDSSLYHSKEALAILEITGKEKSTAIAYRMISDCYLSLGKSDSSFVYLRLATVLNDKLDKAEKEKIQEFQVAGFEEALRSQELEKEKIQTQNKIRTYGLLAGLVVFMLIAFLLYRNNRNRKKANDLLQHKNVEIEQQKKNVEQTLTELKSTQSQLIQSEKMASLGELTAGIAHEIQNPLNFVNNFSEVNTELIDELGEEAEKGNLDEVKAIAKDIKENEQKINHHGKRAGDIVKGMLQHSRTSTGVKEPTNINALADEYLRLSYHGLRAKDKDFNAEMKTDFDATIGKINIIPQDIGRVLLNLFNNAFYAVNEQKSRNLNSYEPTVSVITKKVGDKVEIKVSDNGNGIPQKALDKIFQPFFTTKPTGQGTGLGLSLSYDIVKAHGGEIKVETKEGEGSIFIIQLQNL